jgi:capsular exopolysaccharide synthesis family protein
LRPSIIDAFEGEWRDRLAIGSRANHLLADQFRRLAATLLQVQRGERLRTVMVTSAVPDDGKTLTALNLALVLSESYQRRVLLVEGDLRRPAISRAAGVPPTVGLSEVIKSADERKVALVHLTETLALLPAGRPDPDPLSGLTSARMQAVLHDAGEAFDWVIVDTPPVGAAADASLLCPLVDGVILVVSAGHTDHPAAQQTIETLGRDRILGIVLNRIPEADVVTAGRYHEYQD